jgi:hypothetical protein
MGFGAGASAVQSGALSEDVGDDPVAAARPAIRLLFDP